MSEIEKKVQRRLEKIEEGLKNRFGKSGKIKFFRAPGRLDWLGSHTDYNQGLILASTVNREILAGARIRKDEKINLYSMNLSDEVRISIKKIKPFPIRNPHNWANYPLGVIDELCKAGFKIPGLDLVFDSDIPIGANLSSSAALEAVTLETILGLTNQTMTRWEKAITAWRAENFFVGMPCGILDQFTIFITQKDSALFLDCDTLASQQIPVKFDQIELLVVDSGVGRSLVKSKYQERRRECQLAYQVLKKAGYKIRSLSQLKPEQLDQLRKQLSPLLFRRVRHIVSENQRVLKALNAIQKKDFQKLGELFYEGYESGSKNYENSIPELDLLVGLIRKAPGVLGVRIAGAGWGGCLVSLVKKPDWEIMEEKVRKPYQKKTKRRLDFFLIKTGIPPGELD